MARQRIQITDWYSLESPVATEMRRLLHNLQNLGTKTELKSILITSALTGEGKSTTCSLLGITAARNSVKTLVVDCDLRRPALHLMFDLKRSPGMVELLSEGKAAKDVIQKTDVVDLDVISAGKAWPLPTELFDSRIIGSLISDLKFYYDLVLVDTPPVIPVSDPMLLAKELDGSLLVVKAGETPREIAQRATEILTADHTKLLGVVLNNAKGSLPYYYDHSHYNYDYKQTSPSKDGPHHDGSDKDHLSSRVNKNRDSNTDNRNSGKNRIPR